jgi:hypothetical protein
MSEDNKLYRLEVFQPAHKPRIYTLKRLDCLSDSEIVSAPCRCPYVSFELDCDSTCALFCFVREGSGWTVTLNCSGRILRSLSAIDEG